MVRLDFTIHIYILFMHIDEIISKKSSSNQVARDSPSIEAPNVSSVDHALATQTGNF